MSNPIATARRAANLTQHQLATRVGVSRGAVAQWEMESGTRPDIDNAKILCEVLGLTLEQIFADQPGRAA
ncbi:XRE family transcriptional regulator [Microcystis phage MACPNOA1]|nr:XRE family transcriptional regulator [Microcystis phage MACPNOA1]